MWVLYTRLWFIFSRYRVIYHPPKNNHRNAPCSCESGKKYKRCCLIKENRQNDKLWKNQTDERATELDKAIKESFDGVPFASYTLTNNNAKIKNTRKRIAELERLKETATEQTNETYNTDLFEVIENADIMRLQLRFDGKPDADTRTVLKQNGFRWSPSNGVWQRQLTDNAKFALERVIEELKAR